MVVGKDPEAVQRSTLGFQAIQPRRKYEHAPCWTSGAAVNRELHSQTFTAGAFWLQCHAAGQRRDQCSAIATYVLYMPVSLLFSLHLQPISSPSSAIHRSFDKHIRFSLLAYQVL